MVGFEPLVNFNSKPSDDPIDLNSLVTSVPGSTGGMELNRMCASGDFSSYSSPYTRGEQTASTIDGAGLRVIEAFTFQIGEEQAFQEMHDVLYSSDGWRQMIGDALVIPLGTVASLFNLPGAVTQVLMTPSPKEARLGDDTIFITDKGVYHHNPDTRSAFEGPMAARARKRTPNKKGLLRFDNMKPLPVAGGGLKGPDDPFTCEVAIGLLVPLVAFAGPTHKTPDGMVSFQLESISTRWTTVGKVRRERPDVEIPINAFESGARHSPRVYPHSALMYKMIEAGIAGKLPGQHAAGGAGRPSFLGFGQ